MKSCIRLAVLGAAVCLALAAGSVSVVRAAGTADVTPPEAQPGLTNDECLSCHGQPGQTYTLASGEELYLSIDADAYAAARHGRADCSSCHADITAYPHPELKQANLRQVARDFSTSCKECHAQEFLMQMGSVHAQVAVQGNDKAAVCSDCHNPHYTETPGSPRSNIIGTCSVCHSAVAHEYEQSVHGTVLAGEENPDVPTCVTCHQVHSIKAPDTQFLANSPAMCAGCHTNAAMMAKYGLSTDVLNTYVADFHGTTSFIFEKQTADQLPNTPLCTDCHGIHNIPSVKNAQGEVLNKEALLATCQKCHPDAATNFSAAWLSHYTPSAQKNQLIFYVRIFYFVLIPGVLGGMALFVLTDAWRRMSTRLRAKGAAK